MNETSTAPEAPTPGAADESAPAEPRAVFSLRRELHSWLRDLLLAIGLAVVIIVFLYQPVKVEGTSMAPLLMDQERIFINKFVYHFESIERGDVVVFWYPLDRSKSFIKRVVGLPGERVEIHQGRVLVDGKVLNEPYVPSRYADSSTYGPAQLHADEYFVMGDHRVSSNDSRVFGPVPLHHIYGKAVFAYWPMNHFGSIPSTSFELK